MEADESALGAEEGPSPDLQEALFYDLFAHSVLPTTNTDHVRNARGRIRELRDDVDGSDRTNEYLMDFAEDIRQDALLLGTMRDSEAVEAEIQENERRRASAQRRQELYDNRIRVTELRTRQVRYLALHSAFEF